MCISDINNYLNKYFNRYDLTTIYNVFSLEMMKTTSETKAEISEINSKLDEHVEVCNQSMSHINVELLNVLVNNMLFNKDNHIPKEILEQWISSIIDDKTLNEPVSEFKEEVSNLEQIYRLKEENTINNFTIKICKLL